MSEEPIFPPQNTGGTQSIREIRDFLEEIRDNQGGSETVIERRSIFTDVIETPAILEPNSDINGTIEVPDGIGILQNLYIEINQEEGEGNMEVEVNVYIRSQEVDRELVLHLQSNRNEDPAILAGLTFDADTVAPSLGIFETIQYLRGIHFSEGVGNNSRIEIEVINLSDTRHLAIDKVRANYERIREVSQ